MASHHDVSYRLLSRQSTSPCLHSKRLENESIQFRICQEAQTHISRIGKHRVFHMLQLSCNVLINSSGFQRRHLPQPQCSDQSRYRRHRCTLSVPKSATFFTQLMKRGNTGVRLLSHANRHCALSVGFVAYNRALGSILLLRLLANVQEECTPGLVISRRRTSQAQGLRSPQRSTRSTRRLPESASVLHACRPNRLYDCASRPSRHPEHFVAAILEQHWNFLQPCRGRLSSRSARFDDSETNGQEGQLLFDRLHVLCRARNRDMAHHVGIDNSPE